MSEVLDLRSTIIPKSDQLNADQLLGGPMTIKVTRVSATGGEQPVTIGYEGDGGRPFKPCLTMRKVLLLAWGADGNKWPGKAIRVYTDPSVRWGKDEVGGVRISHLSDIPRDIKVSLAVTRGKKVMYEIKRMADDDQALIEAMKASGTVDALKGAFKKAYRAAGENEERRASFKAEYDRRMQEIAPSALLQGYVAKVSEALNIDAAAVFLDEACGVLNPTELSELNKAFADKFSKV